MSLPFRRKSSDPKQIRSDADRQRALVQGAFFKAALGVSKQVISRYGESGYQGVGLARLQQILDALETKTEIVLTANS